MKTYLLSFLTGEYLSPVDKILLMLAKRLRSLKVQRRFLPSDAQFTMNIATIEAHNAYNVAKSIANRHGTEFNTVLNFLVLQKSRITFADSWLAVEISTTPGCYYDFFVRKGYGTQGRSREIYAGSNLNEALWWLRNG